MDLLSIPEAAMAMGVSPAEMRAWLDAGRVPSIEAAGRRFVRRADLSGLEAPRRDAQLDQLRAEVEDLRRRVERLERPDDEPPRRRSEMRPALTPLFSNRPPGR